MQNVKRRSFGSRRKIIIDEKNVDKETLLMTWAMPYESLQITALKSPDSTKVIIIAENTSDKQKELSNSQDSMVTFLMLPKIAFKDLPKNYYRVKNTEGW